MIDENFVLVKRDTPAASSSSSHPHQTAIIEPMTNKSAPVEITPLTNLMKIPSTSSTSSLFGPNSNTASPLLILGNLSKINKDTTSFHFIQRSDNSQEYLERKILIVNEEKSFNRKKSICHLGKYFVNAD